MSESSPETPAVKRRNVIKAKSKPGGPPPGTPAPSGKIYVASSKTGQGGITKAKGGITEAEDEIIEIVRTKEDLADDIKEVLWNNIRKELKKARGALGEAVPAKEVLPDDKLIEFLQGTATEIARKYDLDEYSTALLGSEVTFYVARLRRIRDQQESKVFDDLSKRPDLDRVRGWSPAEYETVGSLLTMFFAVFAMSTLATSLYYSAGSYERRADIMNDNQTDPAFDRATYEWVRGQSTSGYILFGQALIAVLLALLRVMLEFCRLFGSIHKKPKEREDAIIEQSGLNETIGKLLEEEQENYKEQEKARWEVLQLSKDPKESEKLRNTIARLELKAKILEEFLKKFMREQQQIKARLEAKFT